MVSSPNERRQPQTGWFLSISRFTGPVVLRMVGFAVFPGSQVLRMAGPSVFPIHRSSEWSVLQYFQIHGSKNHVLGPKIDFSRLISSPKRLLIIF